MELKLIPAIALSTIGFKTEGTVWFPIKSRKEVKIEIIKLKARGIKKLRLGIDCTDFNTKNGIKWYDWILPALAENFELELCFDNFSKASDHISSKKHSLPEIVEHFILIHGAHFSLIELWRNPSTRAKHNSSENIFSEDVVFAATWAKHLGKKVSLGKIRPTDFEWITKLVSSQFLKNIEFVEIDKEAENAKNINSLFYERTLRSLFEAKGVKTEVRPSYVSSIAIQTSKIEIA